MSSKNTRAAGTLVKVTPLPLYAAVSAGFPSPADDHPEALFDVGDYLVKNPTATFFVRVKGDSMIGASLHPGDLLVVDRSLPARHGSIIIAVVNGEFTVKRLYKKNGRLELIAANPAYPPLRIGAGDEFIVWGVIAHVIHRPV